MIYALFYTLYIRKETPDNFQSFLEHQWNQSAQFITSKAQYFDGMYGNLMLKYIFLISSKLVDKNLFFFVESGQFSFPFFSNTYSILKHIKKNIC